MLGPHPSRLDRLRANTRATSEEGRTASTQVHTTVCVEEKIRARTIKTTASSCFRSRRYGHTGTVADQPRLGHDRSDWRSTAVTVRYVTTPIVVVSRPRSLTACSGCGCRERNEVHFTNGCCMHEDRVSFGIRRANAGPGPDGPCDARFACYRKIWETQSQNDNRDGPRTLDLTRRRSGRARGRQRPAAERTRDSGCTLSWARHVHIAFTSASWAREFLCQTAAHTRCRHALCSRVRSNAVRHESAYDVCVTQHAARSVMERSVTHMVTPMARHRCRGGIDPGPSTAKVAGFLCVGLHMHARARA